MRCPGVGASGAPVVDCLRDAPPAQDGARGRDHRRRAGCSPAGAAAATAGRRREVHPVCGRPAGDRGIAAGSAAGGTAHRGARGARGSLVRLGWPAATAPFAPGLAPGRRRRGRQLSPVRHDVYRSAASHAAAGGATRAGGRRPAAGDRRKDRRFHGRSGGAGRQRAAPLRPPRSLSARGSTRIRTPDGKACGASWPRKCGGGPAETIQIADALNAALARNDPDALLIDQTAFRDRGLSSDTSILSGYAIERTLEAVKEGGLPGGGRGAAGRADRPGTSTSPTRTPATTSIRCRASSRLR